MSEVPLYASCGSINSQLSGPRATLQRKALKSVVERHSTCVCVCINMCCVCMCIHIYMYIYIYIYLNIYI